MQHLVVRPLQKSGVNGDHGLEPLAGQPGGKGDGVLLGNAYVEIAVGKALVKFDHARAFAHGGRNTHQPNVALGHIAQPLPKHLGKSGFGWRGCWLQTRCHIEFARPMVGDGISLCLRITLAFAGDHMQKLRPFEVAHVLQRGDQRLHIVPIDRADVVEAEFFKQRGRQHHAFGLFFKPFGKFQQGRHPFEHAFAHIARLGIELPAHQVRQIAVQRPHGRADAHVVVVEDDQQAHVLLDPRVVERFKRHACRHGAIADDGNAVLLFALLAGRNGHAQCSRNAGG